MRLSNRPRLAALSRFRFLPALFMCMLAYCLLVPNTAAAKPRVWPVTGTFQTQVQPPASCPPPYTVCSSGIVTGALEGTVKVVIQSSTVSVDASGTPFSRYTGTITVATMRGELSGRVNGQVRLTDGALSSVVTFTQGTRSYHNTIGALEVNGTINLVTGAELDTFQGALYRR